MSLDALEGLDEGFCTTEEFAARARAQVSTVRYWRGKGIGPVGFKVGRRVLYRRVDVDQWLDGLYRHAKSARDVAR